MVWKPQDYRDELMSNLTDEMDGIIILYFTPGKVRGSGAVGEHVMNPVGGRYFMC